MTMIISGDNGLTYPNSSTQASSSVVLQVVQFTTSSQATTTSASPVASGFGASITPKFSTSKILVLMNFNAGISVSATNNNYYIYRGTTPTGYRITAGYVQATAFLGTSCAMCYLDSPSTTSSTTYNLYLSTDGGTAYVRGDPNSTTSITLMEIAG